MIPTKYLIYEYGMIAGQVLLYFNGWFSSCFFSLTICTYGYKAWHYYYPSGALELEIR